ncbi:MAG: glucose-1-phosphate adenylyltransferase [Clostridiaceae bacterium]|nr:glucose-1-phosphate adenylyltransferase [Clostridiaceae bacterium]
MQDKECIALILAGGQGKRLGILTKNNAKPALPFAGKYRIIDFSLSNCYNSNIDTIGVISQYQPFALNSHIGLVHTWFRDRENSGVFLLPPYTSQKGGVWYKGTANAVFQNIEFIERYNARYVLILSGDNIYKMDYSIMLKYHKEKKAEATLSAIRVPWNEAGRFGIISTDGQNRIESFEEKPGVPKNNLASMGVYIFNWDILRKYLTEDEQDPKSSKDFGKDIIPKMLRNQERIYAYPFSGYWKDVGTIESLWEANMDLLSDKPRLDIYDLDWRIHSPSPTCPPNFIGPHAKIRRSIISEGCVILGEVEHSVLSPGVHVGIGSIIRNSVIMSDVKVGCKTVIENAIIGEKTVLCDGCRIGISSYKASGHPVITVIGEKVTIAENSKIIKNIRGRQDRPPLVSMPVYGKYL